MPMTPVTVLVTAPIIWPKKFSKPLVVSCSVNKAATPFLREDKTARGDIDK